MSDDKPDEVEQRFRERVGQPWIDHVPGSKYKSDLREWRAAEAAGRASMKVEIVEWLRERARDMGEWGAKALHAAAESLEREGEGE